MGRSIPISPKHGVNATIPVCFWCGKTRNEIALLGKLPGDVEAPMQTVIDYDPCDECASIWDTAGVALLEVSNQPKDKGQPPIQTKPHYLYPTGRWCVIKPETACRMFDGDFKTGQRLFVDSRVYSDLMAQNQRLSQ